MKRVKAITCTICGEHCPGEGRGFLVTADSWQDKLQILHWDDFVAAQEGVHCTCSAAHLQQLVIHWMTTGSMDHPFADSLARVVSIRQECRAGWTSKKASGTREPRPIGELSVHRESMQRVLRENPQSLQTILDALLAALQKETPRPTPKIDWEAEAARTLPREI